MNKVILCGRLTRDPEVRYSSGENQTAVARYTLAVDRRFKRQGDEQTADFINCVVFGRGAELSLIHISRSSSDIRSSIRAAGIAPGAWGERVLIGNMDAIGFANSMIDVYKRQVQRVVTAWSVRVTP